MIWLFLSFVVVFFFVMVVLLVNVDLVIVYLVGGKFDGLFNESVYGGVICFIEEIGDKVCEFELEWDV